MIKLFQVETFIDGIARTQYLGSFSALRKSRRCNRRAPQAETTRKRALYIFQILKGETCS